MMSAGEKVEECEDVLGRYLRSQFGKMLVPDPADRVGRIVLVLREPEFTFFADDVEDLEEKHKYVSYGLYPNDNEYGRIGEVRFEKKSEMTNLSSNVSKIRITRLASRTVDVKFINTSRKEQHVEFTNSLRRSSSSSLTVLTRG